MLLQTNSYIVPKERRAEHARLIRRFRQALARIGCDQFEVYEQVGANWSPGGANGRYVQIMRFRDRQHQQAVQAAERNDRGAQEIISEFCELINFPYQQQHGYFATGFYTSVLPSGPRHAVEFEHDSQDEGEAEGSAAGDSGFDDGATPQDAGPEGLQPGETVPAEESDAGVAEENAAAAAEEDAHVADVDADAPQGEVETGEVLAVDALNLPTDALLDPAPIEQAPSEQRVELESAASHTAAEVEVEDDDLGMIDDGLIFDDEFPAATELPRASAEIDAHHEPHDELLEPLLDPYGTAHDSKESASSSDEAALDALLDDANLLDNVPFTGAVGEVPRPTAQREPSGGNGPATPAEKDSDLFEFDTLIRKLDEKPSPDHSRRGL